MSGSMNVTAKAEVPSEPKQSNSPINPSTNKGDCNMTTTPELWHLIDETREQADGDSLKHMEILEEVLTEYAPEAIVAFDRQMHECFNRAFFPKLWKAADILSPEGCSEDNFMDFRGWLISQGEHVFESVVNDPEKLWQYVTDQPILESFIYVPGNAWARVTGNNFLEKPEHDIAYTKIWGPDLMDMGDEYVLPILQAKKAEGVALKYEW
jgi:hypothetical protein